MEQAALRRPKPDGNRNLQPKRHVQIVFLMAPASAPTASLIVVHNVDDGGLKRTGSGLGATAANDVFPLALRANEGPKAAIIQPFIVGNVPPLALRANEGRKAAAMIRLPQEICRMW